MYRQLLRRTGSSRGISPVRWSIWLLIFLHWENQINLICLPVSLRAEKPRSAPALEKRHIHSTLLHAEHLTSHRQCSSMLWKDLSVFMVFLEILLLRMLMWNCDAGAPLGIGLLKTNSQIKRLCRRPNSVNRQQRLSNITRKARGTYIII